jgi:type II secretory pathway component GspD/PulD (secretin)
MTMTSRIRIFACIAAVALLGGCNDISQQAESSFVTAADRVDASNRQFQNADTRRAGGVQVDSRTFVGPERQMVAPADRLPAGIRARRDISIVSRAPLSLSEIAARLNESTGIPFVIRLGPTGSPVQVTAPEPTADGTETSAQPVTVSADGGGSPTTSLRIRPNLSGSLGEVLDQISAAFEVEWDYEDGRIVFRDYATRRYQVTLMASTVSASFEAGPLSRAGTYDFWGEVREGLQGLLGGDARVSFGTSTGIISVTARPSDHQAVQRYIAELNEQLGQQVAFDINVLSIILEDESELSLTLSAALNEQNISANFENEPAQAGGGLFNIDVTGPLNINAVVRSLARRGRVAVETRAGAITTNFQPVPIKVTETIAYIASQETIINDNGDSTTTTTPGTIEVGFVLLVTPRVLNSREVLLNYSISLSSNNGFQQLGNLQLPNTSEQVLDQQAIISNGQSLVIAGFEERQTEIDRSGVGNPNFLGLGGNRAALVDRKSTIIIITPRLLTRAGSR